MTKQLTLLELKIYVYLILVQLDLAILQFDLASGLLEKSLNHNL